MIVKTKDKIKFNMKNGTYTLGKGFTEAKWIEIIGKYHKEMQKEGKCTSRRLAEICAISKSSALKAIQFAKKEQIILPNRGNGLVGVGSGLGFTVDT